MSARGFDRAFVTAVRLAPAADGESRDGYPWNLPVVRGLAAGLALHPKVTYLVGENGSGKSTLIDAIAVSAGMNPEGGSSNFAFSTRDSHSELGQHLRLARGARRPRTDFFLRAESLFTAATYVDELAAEDPDGALRAYGGISLHQQSHGESFLALMLNRFGADGIEPIDYEDADLVRLTRAFLDGRDRFLHELLGD